MQIDGLYVVEDHQLYPTGELMMNVYTYVDIAETGDAEDLTLAFNNDMVTAIQNFQTSFTLHTLIRAYNLGDPADFYERTLTGADGVLGSDTLPAFVAVNFTLRAATRAVRPGSKRMGGLRNDTAYYENGVIVDSALLTPLNNFRTALGAPINAAGPDYTPVIVKRVRSGVAPNYTYSWPTSEGESEWYEVAGVTYNTTLSHQTSRGNDR